MSAAEPLTEADEVPLVTIVIKWRNTDYPLTLPVDATLADVKGLLEAETDVPQDRQKLIGLVKGKLPDDSTVLSALNLALLTRVTMLGTPAEHQVKAPSEMEDLPEIVNDLEWDFNPNAKSEVKYRPENQLKLQKRIRRLETIPLIHPLREGKKLLCLDLDYTLWDHKSARTVVEILKRPFCDDFLTEAYKNYDICVWSQTSWSALEAKLTELGLLNHPGYKISFVLDRSSMFSVESIVRGEKREHEVKPLALIWAKFPQFSAANSIHIDDLSRNFAMNPECGLKISAFRDAPVAKNTDKELLY